MKDDDEDEDSETDAQGSNPSLLKVATSARPVIRHAGSERALEIDLEAGDAEPAGPTAEEEANAELVADLTQNGQRFILCKGGRGGLGNRNFATSRRQTPVSRNPAKPGHEGNFKFELRFMADIAVLGYPNAGKSTLLTAIVQTRPKSRRSFYDPAPANPASSNNADFKRLVVCDVPG